ncbi:hypothetical protein [Haloarcula sp. K1]|uniref:hypothetical protein n=1 Tax=Haloarcula sp. K1 TaxID=1622207 RepID=UPI000B26F99B|nr:hypothetical protein [Haloarcula sp. K1]
MTSEYWDQPVRGEQFSIENKRKYWETFRTNPTSQSLLEFGETWWAYRHFGDPAHFVRKRTLNKGYTATEMRDLLERAASKGPEAINEDIPGMGVATLSELLEVIDPSQYATLNSKSCEGLRDLGYSVPGNNPDKTMYSKFTEHVKEIVPKYGLEKEVDSTVSRGIPDGTENIDIAQVAFEMNHNDRFSFSLSNL